LRFSDARKFGRVYLAPDAEWVVSKMGPEPLSEEFTVDVLRERLAGRSRQLKPLLLDQEFVAGVGNIYANEALWLARLHPARRSNALSVEEIERLYEGIREALRRGLAHGGSSINWYRQADGSRGSYQDEFLVHDRADHPCPRCGAPIRREVIGQRSSFYCPKCQT
jgi:formamidopyrimidine-DNA glycosylase